MPRRWIIATFACCALAHAAVVRVDVASRTDLPNGYERLTGKVYFAVDPKLPANRIITDIDLAPKNAQGLVEFSSDLYVLRPKDASKSNGTALFEIPNRGGRGMMGSFDLAAGGDDLSGDPLVFDQGFTLVWLGWQFDVPEGGGRLKLYAPTLKGITGMVHSDITVDRKATVESLGDGAQPGYAVADPSSGALTVRDQVNGPRITIPRSQWRFASDGTHIEFDAGFEPGRIYEVVYLAKNPVVAGLGPAAVRDYVSYIKQHGDAKRVIGFGNSQSGRFLRTFLYYGFNADEHQQRAFDGVWAHVAGAGRGSFNHRFAQPSRDAQPRHNLFYPTDVFPFTDDSETDSGITDAVLARAKADGVIPKIFYSNGSYEYWGRVASLIHISPDGKRDVAPSKDTRIYYISGAQHTANANSSRNTTQNLTNPLDYRLALRALLLQLNAWVTNGTEPPASRYPRIDRGELATEAALKFPKIPGIELPNEPSFAWRLDFGPEFRGKGIITNEPTKVSTPFAVLLPQVNGDGNEIAGVHLPDQAVPLATYTGWNLRAVQTGAPNARPTFLGSMIPFARTRAEREANGDPRPSIEERYKNLDDYLARVEASAKASVKDGFLLDRDVPLAMTKAKQRWTALVGQ
jgi:hypothetical protein